MTNYQNANIKEGCCQEHLKHSEMFLYVYMDRAYWYSSDFTDTVWKNVLCPSISKPNSLFAL